MGCDHKIEMSFEAFKAWIGIVTATIPLSWALFASADTAAWGFVVVILSFALGAYLGYAYNRRGVHPALLILLGYFVAFFAVALALAAEQGAAWALAGVAVFSLACVSAGIGSLVRRHLRPRAGDTKPRVMTVSEVLTKRSS
jgi:hypothetical protein